MIAQRTPVELLDCPYRPYCGCPDDEFDPSCPQILKHRLPHGARPGTFPEMASHGGAEAAPYPPLDRSWFWASVLVGSIVVLAALSAYGLISFHDQGVM